MKNVNLITENVKTDCMFLQSEKNTLEKYFPGMLSELESSNFEDLEKRNGLAIPLFVKFEGPSLLVPKHLDGKGASAYDAVEIHRILGRYSPSMAIAATMHNFSVATLVEYSLYGDQTNDILKQVAEYQLLVASGFAEGKTSSSILKPSIKAEISGGEYIINGVKKPCTLSKSMSILTASVAAINPSAKEKGYQRAIAIIPADTPGISTEPFWKSAVLTGSESDQLILKDVHIPSEAIFFPESSTNLDTPEQRGFLWFELLTTASYVGVASNLVDRVVTENKGFAIERINIICEIEMAMSALKGFSHQMQQSNENNDRLLADILAIRFSAQKVIERVCAQASEILGGMAFISSNEVAYILGASRALAYHPPSRISVAEILDDFYAGQSCSVIIP